jgi:hypothetical protein
MPAKDYAGINAYMLYRTLSDYYNPRDLFLYYIEQ